MSPTLNCLNVAGAVHSSETAVTEPVVPPNINATVLVPAPPPCPLEVAKSASSVHEVPSQYSVAPVTGLSLPKPNPAVTVPTELQFVLPVFISATSVQLEPSHCSTAVDPDAPPKLLLP